MKLLFLHACEIKPWTWPRNTALESPIHTPSRVDSPHTCTHTHTSGCSKLTNWLLTRTTNTWLSAHLHSLNFPQTMVSLFDMSKPGHTTDNHCVTVKLVHGG